MLLINPPLTKPCEPPCGIGKLCGFLKGHDIEYTVLDANLEGILYLLGERPDVNDKWSERAWKNLSRNLSTLRRRCDNFDRYKRAVMDVNRLIEVKGNVRGVHLSLSDYRDEKLSPVMSNDLLRAAEYPEENIFYPYFKDRLAGIIENRNPQFVGFSLNYLSQALCTVSMAGFLRKTYPSLKIIMGGGLVTSWVRSPVWNNPFGGVVDYFIDGPGEEALLSLAGKVPMDGEYLPDYGSLPMGDYFAPGIILPYSASSGCYWNRCSFCPEKAEGNLYRPLGHGRVIKELGMLIGEVKPSLVHFTDNAVSPGVLRKLIDNPLSVPWYGFTRIIDDFADYDYCSGLKKSGCIMLKLGLESGSQYVLDKMGKGIDLNVASRALKTLKKAGIGTYVYLLFGTPQETMDDGEKTLKFIVNHSEYIDFLNIAIFNMPLYGPDAVKADRKDFYEGDLSLYTDFIHRQGWNRKDVRHFLEKKFKKHRAVSEIIRRNPPYFTSNHASFFVKS